jgi:hypothetical protein
MLRSCKAKIGLLSALLVGSSLYLGSACAKQYIELKDARFPTRQVTESANFNLQGAGILKWGIWFDIYAAAYYIDQINPQNQQLVIQYFVPIEVRQIKAAAEKHLLKQQGDETFASIKPALDRLHAAMEDVAQGDSYALTLHQERELVLARNGTEVVRISDPQLGRAYLNLWLGDDPLDEKLKLSLLGAKQSP